MNTLRTRWSPHKWAWLLAIALGAPAFAGEGDDPASPPQSAPLRYEAHRTWRFVLPARDLQKVDKTIDVALGAKRTYAARLDGQTLQVDTDGDGSMDVAATGEQALIRLHAGEGDKARTYAVRLANQQGSWWYGTSGSWTATLAGTTVRLIDANADGDVFDVGEDAMIVGDGTHASYLSDLVALDGALWTLRVTGDAAAPALEATPYTGPTGSLNLVAGFKTQGRLLSAVIRSTDEKYSFDLAQHPKGLEMPVGLYEFMGGVVGKGNARVGIKAGNMDHWEIAEGASVAPTWGGPLRATFSWVRQGKQVLFRPDLVTYRGRGGELYEGWSPAGSSPEFIVKAYEDEATSAKEVARIRFGGC